MLTWTLLLGYVFLVGRLSVKHWFLPYTCAGLRVVFFGCCNEGDCFGSTMWVELS